MNNIEGIEFLKRQFVFLESVLKHGKRIFDDKVVYHKLFLLLFIIRCHTFKYCGFNFSIVFIELSFSDLILHFGKVESFYYMYESDNAYPSANLDNVIYIFTHLYIGVSFLYRRYFFASFKVLDFTFKLNSSIFMDLSEIAGDVQGFLARVERVEREGKKQIEEDLFTGIINELKEYINREDISVVNYCLIFNLYIQLQIVKYISFNVSDLLYAVSYFNANRYNKLEYKNILAICIKEISAYDLRFTRVRVGPLFINHLFDPGYRDYIHYQEIKTSIRERLKLAVKSNVFNSLLFGKPDLFILFYIFVNICQYNFWLAHSYTLSSLLSGKFPEGFLVKFFSDITSFLGEINFLIYDFGEMYSIYCVLFYMKNAKVINIKPLSKNKITPHELLVEVVALFKKLLQG